MPSYAVQLTTRYDGLVVATFPDFPGISALGVDDEDARVEARRALADALEAMDRDGLTPPAPRAPGGTVIAVELEARPVLA